MATSWCSQGKPLGLRGSSRLWGPRAWSSALLRYQPTAQLQGCQLSCHAWRRALPTLQCSTAGTAQHCWELNLFLGLPGGWHPHCTKPTRRHPAALACPHLPGHIRHGVLWVLTRMSVPSLRPGPDSSPVPRSAAVPAGRRMGRLAERASRAACSTFSSSPGLAAEARSCQSPQPRGAWAGLIFAPPPHLSPAGSVPRSGTPQTEGRAACWTGPGRCPPCSAQSPSSQRPAAAHPCGIPSLWVLWGLCAHQGHAWHRHTHPRDFFFMAGTISASMSTFRSNLRVKHSLLGSCRRHAAHQGLPPISDVATA